MFCVCVGGVVMLNVYGHALHQRREKPNRILSRFLPPHCVCACVRVYINNVVNKMF